jgi:hypothetical protein
MTTEEFEKLDIGDIVTHVDGDGWVVVAKGGNLPILSRTMLAMNPREWEKYNESRSIESEIIKIVERSLENKGLIDLAINKRK